jgi:hypothetical protein
MVFLRMVGSNINKLLRQIYLEFTTTKDRFFLPSAFWEGSVKGDR